MSDIYIPPGGGGSGTVTSGDGVVENVTPTAGALTLANAPAYTALVNNTGSSAAPTYGPSVFSGYQTLTTTTTLTAASPAINYLDSANVTYTLPVASTALGRFYVFNGYDLTNQNTVVAQGSDRIYYSVAGSGTSATIYGGGTTCLYASAANTWVVIFGNSIGPVGPFTPGGVLFADNNAYLDAACTAAAAGAGYIFQSGTSGTGTPTWTLTPGATTALTSITANHQLSSGSTPSFTAGAGAGSGPTITITGTDSAGYISVLTGSAPSASSVVVTVTFNVAYGATPRAVIVTPASSNEAVLTGTANVWADQGGVATTGFTLNVGSTGLAATTTYLFWYDVRG
jgi:hypothetical protein